MQEILKGQHYVVYVARNNSEALEIVELDTPDVVLLDVQMPSMSGLELMKEIREKLETESLPAILLTSEKLDIRESNELRSDYNVYLSKTFQLKELLEAIVRILPQLLR